MVRWIVWRVVATLLVVGAMNRTFADSPLPEVARFDFERGDFGGWKTQKLVFPHSGTVVREPVRQGSYAARFELRATDDTGDGVRAELKDPYVAPLRQVVWYSFSTCIPTDFPMVDRATVISQWKGYEDAGEKSASRSPILSHRYRNGDLIIDMRTSRVKFQTTNDGERRELYRKHELSKGVWHDFVYKAIWSCDDDGRLEGWMNGTKIIDHIGPIGYNDDNGPYFKFGLYHHGGEMPFVIYHDDYRRGPSAEDVGARERAAKGSDE